MKIIRCAVICCLAAALVACSSEKKENTVNTDRSAGVDGYTVENVSYADSVVYGESKAVAECTIGYLKPDSLTTPLIDNVNAWTRYALGNTAGAKMGEPLARDVVAKALDSNGADLKEWNEAFGSKSNLPAMSYEMSYSVKPLVLEPTYVTMMFTSYIYLGGAHGEAAAVGQTFDAVTGVMLDDNMFRTGTEDTILALVKNGLMEQYFKVTTEKEFNDCLLSDNGDFSLPANPPYFTGEGVCFQYQQYEIAPYSAGMPECTVPFATIRPYLTDAVAALIP
ncbi:MAG: DUF3298 and DUF4163 domain-containing protein [Muribaculaceae bacterium]|nr:DUF3298 and DUF4163 domain-containing protein [Muribaculaceae bacterium]